MEVILASREAWVVDADILETRVKNEALLQVILDYGSEKTFNHKQANGV